MSTARGREPLGLSVIDLYSGDPGAAVLTVAHGDGGITPLLLTYAGELAGVCR